MVQPYSSIVRQRIRKGENPKNVLTSALNQALFCMAEQADHKELKYADFFNFGDSCIIQASKLVL